MTSEKWDAVKRQRANRDLERRKLEVGFNAEILKRHKAGIPKEEIVASMGISRELFNRVVMSEKRQKWNIAQNESAST